MIPERIIFVSRGIAVYGLNTSGWQILNKFFPLHVCSLVCLFVVTHSSTSVSIINIQSSWISVLFWIISSSLGITVCTPRQTYNVPKLDGLRWSTMFSPRGKWTDVRILVSECKSWTEVSVSTVARVTYIYRKAKSLFPITWEVRVLEIISRDVTQMYKHI